jgi:hemerythrin-like domain-containing protein
MRAIDILMDEHRTIEPVLDALERAADHLARAGTVRPSFFLDAVTFITGFADGCHHQKEEGVLFPAMIEGGTLVDGGPIAMMLEEHQEGRRYAGAIRDAATRLTEADPTARGHLISATRGYVALLRDHIQKEDDLVFPMADGLLSPARQDGLVRDFGRLDAMLPAERTTDRLRALAESLVREAAALV